MKLRSTTLSLPRFLTYGIYPLAILLIDFRLAERAIEFITKLIH